MTVESGGELREKKSKRLRLSPQAYQWCYAALVERDGEQCSLCGVGPPLEIDHVNSNLNDLRLSTKRLLCKSCNVKEQHRLLRFMAESVKRERETGGIVSPVVVRPEDVSGEISYESRKNLESEPRYVDWVMERLKPGQMPLSVNDAIYGAAYLFQLSPTTTRKYLMKLASLYGPLEIYKAPLKIGSSFFHGATEAETFRDYQFANY